MSYNFTILVIVDDVGSEPGYRSQRADENQTDNKTQIVLVLSVWKNKTPDVWWVVDFDNCVIRWIIILSYWVIHNFLGS